MLDLLFNLGLDTATKRTNADATSSLPPFSIGADRAVPDGYRTLQKALHAADRRGLLDGERRRLVARLHTGT